MSQRPRDPSGQWEWDGYGWLPVQVPPPPAQSKRPGRLLLIGGVCALFLIGIVGVVGNNSRAAKPSSAPAASAATTAAPVAVAPAATPAHPQRDGSCSPQPCQNDSYGWIVTISNLRYEAPGGFMTPEQGNVFVTMDVSFTNKLKDEEHANPTEFVLKDASGVKHTLTVTEACPIWSPVNLTQGASFGPRCIAFEASAGKPSGLVLTWSPHFGADYDIKVS